MCSENIKRVLKEDGDGSAVGGRNRRYPASGPSHLTSDPTNPAPPRGPDTKYSSLSQLTRLTVRLVRDLPIGTGWRDRDQSWVASASELMPVCLWLNT